MDENRSTSADLAPDRDEPAPGRRSQVHAHPGNDASKLIERITGLVLGALSAYVIALEFPRVWPQHGLWDFGSFVASGRAARDGLNPYGVYPLTAHVSLSGFESWNPNLNPPISAVLFQVFDWADPTVSLRTWWWVSLACYVITAVLVLRRFGRSQPVSLGLWMFALAGFWDTLFLGQIYLPFVLASVVAWILLERGETVWAGVLIGLVVAIKPNFLVWPVLLFLSGHRTPAVVTLITAAVISAVPLAVYGPEVYQQWLELVASDSNRAAFLTNASLSGLAARAGVPALRLVFSAALLGSLALWAFWRRPSAMRASALALVASLLASPIGWIHYTLF